MHIGYHGVVVTPQLDRPVYLAGFDNDRRATDIHDDLWVRALAIHGTDCTVVLVAVDVIGLFRPDTHEVITRVTQQVRMTPDVPLHIIISPSHTHHGPDTMGLWGPTQRQSGVDVAYMQLLKDRMVACILQAIAQRIPARLRSVVVRAPGWIKNTRDPDIIDDELTVLQCLDHDGHVRATLGNYPCHPEVLVSQNQTITSDYVHFWRTAVERHTGAPCLFMPGALGGMLTPAVRDQTFVSAQQMGEQLAEVALHALATPAQADAAEEVLVAVQTEHIIAKLTNPLYKLAFWQRVLPDVRDQHGRVHTEVSIIRLGGLWFACVPGELFPKLGLRVKMWMRAAGAQHCGVIGLANDELGYIVPLEDFKYPWNPFAPGDHYEETNSIGKSITVEVMNALKRMLA